MLPQMLAMLGTGAAKMGAAQAATSKIHPMLGALNNLSGYAQEQQQQAPKPTFQLQPFATGRQQPIQMQRLFQGLQRY